MHIGYDGKRAFQNRTGLGNYIRSLLAIFTQHYPGHRHTLFAPKLTDLFNPAALPGVYVTTPTGFFYKKFPALWRRMGMVKNIAGAGLDIYHGVSNELPRGIKSAHVKTVVTVHDLIFEHFPETYNFDERYVHRWKIKYACRVADAVIAISQQTKNDLIELYKVPAEKIFICYQSCNPIFQRVVSDEEKIIVKSRYQLPDKYFLFVSSIAPRKNLISICKAMAAIKDKLDIPLVVIGNGKKEKEEARQLMAANDISERLIILNELPQSKELSFTTAADFPAIYQQAMALVYPSIFEGFGAPLLEALWSGLPVISSNASCLPEVAGDAALYFTPYDYKTLAMHMETVATNSSLQHTLRLRGMQQAHKFTIQSYAESVMRVYKNLMNKN
jgi:glycosyltransferase involved in cell wall biosynthesis